MKERNILLVLSMVLIVGFGYWSLFFNARQKEDLVNVNYELEQIMAKVRSAQMARENIALLKKRYDEEQKKLHLERQRFVDKSDLSVVTGQLKQFAAKYHLQLMDFSPAFESYFASSKYNRIIALPIELSVEGKYLDIGRFIEDWDKLPFYLVADELSITRTEYDPNMLKAQVKSLLYTWNDANKEE